MKRMTLDVGGRKVQVWAENLDGKLWVHYEGRTLVGDLKKKSSSRSGQRERVGSGLLEAPMPGRILKAMVSEGEMVSSGQAILVLEAMKMEYTLEADIDGKVVEVWVSEGEQVSQGQKLAKIAP